MTTYHTPIHLACLAGNTQEIMSMLKQDRRLVHARDHEDTPLHCAATEAVARLLIAWKADVNARGWMGQTPLHVAAAQGRLALVRLLIQQGARVNAQRERGDIPLHWAANAEIAQLLIEHGAVLEAQDCFGQRPLHWAARYAHADVVSVLLSHNADVHARNEWGQTPLFLAVGNRKSLRTKTSYDFCSSMVPTSTHATFKGKLPST
jgi:ankyrin repeat protein